MENARYIVGIDLGTTNSVVAYTDLEAADASEIKIFKIPQITGSGVVEARNALPSFLYLLDGSQESEASLELPWGLEKKMMAGVHARQRGGEVPHRLVSSSKSWLCNPQVDREAPILPWEEGGGAGEFAKISPVEASSHILTHIRKAWDFEMAQDDPNLVLAKQDIYLTVPASFDAVARELTVKAAQMTGLTNVTLIEEPQAAFYSWIDRSNEKWRDQVEKGDLVLVCDVGGGTSDFSLIEVQEDDGNLTLERLAVGEHLLVGGDNIDLSLAYFLAAKLQEKGKKLDAWQMRGLVHSCRNAKESLFSGDYTEEGYPVTILGRGSGLIKGTIKARLEYEDVEGIVLSGFFPETALEGEISSSNMAGIREFGLNYEADPGITRHLGKFLSAHRDDSGRVRLPTAVVFNGGVMKSGALRERVIKIISSWSDNGVGNENGQEDGHRQAIREIDTGDFDLSVAWGAAYYGQASRGDGIRIRGGLASSYYLAVEAAMPAIPGIVLPTRALCIAPFGMEEGTDAENKTRLFNLVVGETVRFNIMTSTTRHNDQLGDIVDNWEYEDEIRDLTTIETFLEGDEDNAVIPVTFEVRLTEVGTLEFWACARDSDQRWKLELNVRPK